MAESRGCDCVSLCEMGPTCPGGMLAGLPDSGCWRSETTCRQCERRLPPEPDPAVNVFCSPGCYTRWIAARPAPTPGPSA